MLAKLPGYKTIRNPPAHKCMKALFEACILLLTGERSMLRFTNDRICCMIFVSLYLKFCKAIDVCCRKYIFIGVFESGGTVWHSLIMPFGPGLWLALVLILLALSAFLCLKAKFYHCCGAELEPDCSFLRSLFCVFGVFCFQGKTQSAITCKTWKCCKILWL